MTKFRAFFRSQVTWRTVRSPLKVAALAGENNAGPFPPRYPTGCKKTPRCVRANKLNYCLSHRATMCIIFTVYMRRGEEEEEEGDAH